MTGETSTREGTLLAMAWLGSVLLCPFKITAPPGRFLEALFLDETCNGVQVFSRWVMCFEGNMMVEAADLPGTGKASQATPLKRRSERPTRCDNFATINGLAGQRVSIKFGETCQRGLHVGNSIILIHPT